MSWRPEPGMAERQIKEALNIRAALLERRVRTGQVLDGHVTFAEFAGRWKRDYAEPNLALKAFARYEALLKRIPRRSDISGWISSATSPDGVLRRFTK